MKQPIWIINSSILALLLVLEGIVYVFHISVPRKVSLTPSTIEQVTSVSTQSVDIEQIYTNDIFGTYIPTTTDPETLIRTQVLNIPSAPAIVPVSIPAVEQPTFVAPLDVTLKGVMFLVDDQLNSVIVVQNNASQVETNYRVGEFIEDAQLLKIFADKALVIRSNGQQEMLYLREEDAAQDLELEDAVTVQSGLVFNTAQNAFAINTLPFVRKITNLGQFIDSLGLITVYNQGQAAGCRVGSAGDGSLGEALGLQEGDVIISVDGNSITDLNSGIVVYNSVVKKSMGDTISVVIRRDSLERTFVYTLVNESRAKVLANKYSSSTVQTPDVSTSDLIDTLTRSDYEVEAQRREILSRKVAMAPTKKQIEEQELSNLLKARRS